ncbi:MAG: hypothetical protein AAGG68_12625 [Bacteroidota bacterium]
MGVFNDLKKVLFGASSVAKHNAEKAANAGKEATEKLADNLEEVGEKVAQKTGEHLEKAQQFTEEVGGEVLKKAESFWEKTKEVAEDVGAELIEKGKIAKEKAQEFASEAEARIKEQTSSFEKKTTTPPPTEDMADDILNDVFGEKNTSATEATAASENMASQAKEQVEDTDSIFEQLMDKAENLSDKLKENLGDYDAPRETKIGYDNAKGSLLDGQDDFFERAKRFADGDYHNTGSKDGAPIKKEGDIEIRQNPDYQKPVNEGKVKGFEDLDGDGDEIIDDAIILDD